jgi:hypothetical protein
MVRQRRTMDRRANANVRPAATEVASHGDIDLRVGGGGVGSEERRSGHQLSGLTIATLWNVFGDPRAL